VIKSNALSPIFKASPFIGLILLPDYPRFTIAAATDAYLKAFKVTESEILEIGFFENLDQSGRSGGTESLSSLHQVFLEAMENGISGKLEGFYLKLKNEDGSSNEITYVDVEVIPVLSKSDSLESIIVSFKEIEKKTFTTNPGSENNQSYQSILENSSNAFFLTKPDGTILDANKTACDLFGYSLEELRQVGREGIIDHNDAFVLKKIRERDETGRVTAELVGKKKSGERFPIECSSVIFSDVNGEKKTSTSINDITLRKQVEQDLRISEKKYKTLFEDNPLPMLIWDFETRNIIDCNEEAILKYGYTREEFLQLSIREIRPKEDFDLIDSAIANESVYGQIHKRVWRHLKKNGELMLMEVTGHLMDYNGRRVSLVLLNDVTERKNEEQQKVVLAEISRLFNQSLSFSETLNKVIQCIASTGDYCMAEAWLIGSDKKSMNLLAQHVTGDGLVLLGAQDYTRNVELGKGLSAIVGQTKTTQEWDFEEGKDYFISTNGALIERIKKVIGIPLLYNETIVGSLLLGSNTVEKRQQDFIFQSHDFRTQLGAEIKRKYLEQELNQVFDNSNDIICIADFNGYFKKINPVASEILGYSEEELLSRPFTDFVHPDDLKLTEVEAASHLKGESAYYFENRYISKSGKIIWFAWSSSSSPEERLIFAVAKDITEKKKLEVLLNKSNRLSGVGSWEIDVLNGTVFWSDITKEIREVDLDFVPDLSMGISYFKEGDSRNTISNLVSECIEKGTPWDEELQILTHKGNLKWIRTIGEAEMINGKCIRVFGSFQDIDEKKKALIKLAESENKFRTILEAEPECIKLLGPDGKLVMMNPAGLAMIEADNEAQVIGKSVLEIILPEHRAAFSNLTKNVFKGEPGKLAFEIKGLKGTRRWLETHAVPMNNEQGDIISLLGVTRDITLNKMAEESLRLSNERFEKVTEATNDAIRDWDIVNKTYYRSKGIERFFGKSAVGLFPETDMWTRDHFHPGDRDRIKHSFQVAIKDPSCTRWESEYRVINELGEMRYVIDRAVITRNSVGKAVRAVGVMTDITYRKEYEESLKQLNETLALNAKELAISNKELEQFAFVASHDLQEPLRMVTSFLNQLEKKYGETIDEKGKQYIYFAVDGAKRMRQIILDLLEFSRVGRLENDAELVNSNEMMSEIISLYSLQIEESNASIELGELPIIKTHKLPLFQVFHNLIGNALKYRHPGNPPLISINCTEMPGYWKFSIQDNGIGIDEQYFEKIFIIFQRLHNKNEYSGTGIGLAIVKKIINSLDGKIWVESRQGAGAIFYFTLPK
jgi:PAS domain S-box-containing protein